MNKTILFAGNLTFGLEETELRAAFAVYGEVIEARIIYRDGISRGFGFVEMGSEDDAAKAMTALDGKILAGQTLKVGWALEGPKRLKRTAYFDRTGI